MVAKTDQVTIRLEGDTLELADEVASLIAKATGLEEPARASIMRTALRKGLEQMKAELQAKMGKRR